MNKNIRQALDKLFDQHRLVFWYDTDREMRADFTELDLPEVAKVEIDNDEFTLKYRIVRQEPERKFLIYRAGPAPEDIDNWLLDLELSHGLFYADQVTIWLNELGLGREYGEFIREYAVFFKAVKRRNAFKAAIKTDDNRDKLRLTMLSICCAAETRLDVIMETLLGEMALNRDDKIKLVERCGLNKYLWDKISQMYAYQSESPGLKDFVIELFRSCYDGEINQSKPTQIERQVFLNRWKDSVRHGDAFTTLANDCAKHLNIENDLQERDLEALQEIDYFSSIDLHILKLLVDKVKNRTISLSECSSIVKKRRASHWYHDFADIYAAVEYAAQFLHHFHNLDLEIDSATTALQKYTMQWFKLDQFYRKFIFHSLKSGQTTLLYALSDLIENTYNNQFLLTVNNNWQKIVDNLKRWQIPGITAQADFFRNRVKPFLSKNQKVTVIVSDALRYEIGDELASLINQEDRYRATVDPMLAILPSSTQFGMTALLPHQKLEVAADDSINILVDGLQSSGTSNRAQILERNPEAAGTAIKADNLLALSRDECRSLTRENRVVYVYHNRIDATGDKKESEGRVFEAVEESLKELLKIIKKLAAANVSNILLTADHGFIYQNRVLDDSDFAVSAPEAEATIINSRRFIIGRNFYPDDTCRVFTTAETGLVGNYEVALPKSINRLRLKGSGSRFVHGGASLQETILPVVKINKKRTSDISLVEIDVLQGGNAIITSGQFTVVFYQRQAVTDKIQPRTLKTAVYSQEGDLISDSHDLVFDTTSENSIDRELQTRFILAKSADNLNDQEVVLRLEERIDDTSHFREYKSYKYRLRRSFATDFDL